jgi:glycosyltransferase involved in cell wall biosynthesis
MSEHPYRAAIAPVPEGEPRPLWSVMIPTYNCATYLRQTLTSVLEQDLGSDIMQIEVVDDRSTKDDPQAVVEELGKGRVSFYQQPENVGHTRNFETCLQRSRGQLIHLLHGDDCIRDGFYRQMQRGFTTRADIGAAFCRHIFMDENNHWQWISQLESQESGVLNNWLEYIAAVQRIQTPSIVVQRHVYEELGGFDRRLSWAEDWEMWVRIAAQYPVWYEIEPLALYRVHSSSNTGRYIRTGENIRDLRRAIDITKNYLPDERAGKISKSALEHYAFFALNQARDFASSGDKDAAMIQMKEALRCHISTRTVKSALNLTIKLLYQQMFQPSALKSGT